jgi:hypothetical protein
MYGPAFMVSPVTAKGITSRSVYLPAGKWYDFWTGAVVNGGASVTADAPLSQIPLHIRAGAIVPMGPEIQYATERSDTIELRVYAGANGSFTIYEDEGDNYNYETGKYATIPITYDDNSKNVIIGARTGSFQGMDAKKVFNVVFVGTGKGTGIGVTATPDKQLIYTGEQVSILPVGIRSARAQITPMTLKATFRTAGNLITLPAVFQGKSKVMKVYDCSGKLVYKSVVKKNVFDVRKELKLPGRVYVVRVDAMNQ